MRQKSIENIVKKAEDLSTTSDNLLNSLSRFEDANDQPFDVKSLFAVRTARYPKLLHAFIRLSASLLNSAGQPVLISFLYLY